jgi:N-acetylmuramoyl-L-alanine amidase
MLIGTVDKTDEYRPARREFIKMGAAVLLISGSAGRPTRAHANGLVIRNRYSPFNRKRPVRPDTLYIVLHTTEGEEAGSLRKIVTHGEAHYCVTTSGLVYRIVDSAKIATHAGRSMWEERSPIDNHSVGIEVIGYHNKDINDAQYEALRELLRQLKSLYRISDQNVLTHSMVAYGRPNRFQNSNHRGRKRCGMIFARPEVRSRLGLESGPQRDPDVQAGRLTVGDKQLFTYLFASPKVPDAEAGRDAQAPTIAAAKMPLPPEPIIVDKNWTAWEIARDQYNDPSTTYVFPNGKRVPGDQIRDWAQIPAGTRILLGEMADTQSFEGFLEVGKDGSNAKAIAGTAYASDTTIYFFPDGFVRTGAELRDRASGRKLLENPPTGTRVLVGYIYGGYVQTRRPAAVIAGVKWNYPSTYYRLPDGRMLSGDDVDATAIPAGTLVFYQR